MANNDYFSKILAQLFLLQRSMCRLEKYYQFNYQDFVTTLKNIIQAKGFKVQPDAGENESPATDLIYDANTASSLSSEIEFTKKSFEMLKKEDTEVVLKEFEKQFFMKLKRFVYRVFILHCCDLTCTLLDKFEKNDRPVNMTNGYFGLNIDHWETLWLMIYQWGN